MCTVRSSCRMLSNFNSPSICFSPCLVFLFYIRFGGEKNLVSIKINATKFVSVFVLLACIIVSFLFSRASHHGFQVYSSWERCFFHSLLFSLSLSLAKSLLLRSAPCPSFACRPSFSSSVGHVSNYPTKEEKTSGNSFIRRHTTLNLDSRSLLKVSNFSSSLVSTSYRTGLFTKYLSNRYNFLINRPIF